MCGQQGCGREVGRPHLYVGAAERNTPVQCLCPVKAVKYTFFFFLENLQTVAQMYEKAILRFVFLLEENTCYQLRRGSTELRHI